MEIRLGRRGFVFVCGTLLSVTPAMAEDAIEPNAFQAPASATDASTLTTGSEEKVEVIQERYANASVRIERSVTLDDDGNYVNHGPWAGWDEAGRLVAKGEYKHNLPHGHWVKFFKAGEGNLITGATLKEFSAPFVSEASFDEGLLNGTWTITDAKDRKVCEMTFEKDIQQGPMIWYYSNGQKSHESLYKDGKLEGPATDFAVDGKITGKAVYLDGRKLGTEVEQYSPGKKKSERAFSYAVPRTTYNFFECTVKTTPVAENKDKQAHGASTWWYPNGQKQLEGTYKHNVPIGVFTWWYSNGQKQSEGAYVDGVQDGHWVRWHENGQKQWIGDYAMGERTGKWPEWKADGKVVAIEDFSTATVVDGSSKSTTSATVDGSKPEVPGPAARSARTNNTKGRR